jgi:hypothetical protein
MAPKASVAAAPVDWAGLLARAAEDLPGWVVLVRCSLAEDGCSSCACCLAAAYTMPTHMLITLRQGDGTDLLRHRHTTASASLPPRTLYPTRHRTEQGRKDWAKAFVDEQLARPLDRSEASSAGSSAAASAVGADQILAALPTVSADNAGCRQLLAINTILAAAPPRLALILVERGLHKAVARLHGKAGDLASRFTRTAAMLLFTTALVAMEAHPSSAETVASAPEVPEVLITQARGAGGCARRSDDPPSAVRQPAQSASPRKAARTAAS